MNANRKPTGSNIHRLAAKLGTKIYTIMEQTPQMPDDPQLRLVAERWFELPEDIRDLVIKVIEGDDLTNTEMERLQDYISVEAA